MIIHKPGLQTTLTPCPPLLAFQASPGLSAGHLDAVLASELTSACVADPPTCPDMSHCFNFWSQYRYLGFTSLTASGMGTGEGDLDPPAGLLTTPPVLLAPDPLVDTPSPAEPRMI